MLRALEMARRGARSWPMLQQARSQPGGRCVSCFLRENQAADEWPHPVISTEVGAPPSGRRPNSVSLLASPVWGGGPRWPTRSEARQSPARHGAAGVAPPLLPRRVVEGGILEARKVQGEQERAGGQSDAAVRDGAAAWGQPRGRCGRADLVGALEGEVGPVQLGYGEIGGAGDATGADVASRGPG